MKEKFPKILKWFAKIWSGLVILSVFVGIIGIFITASSLYEGWLKFTEAFSPFNVLNYLVILILLSPAIGAYYLSERLSKSNKNSREKW